MSTAENYITNAIYENRTLTINFDDVIFNEQTDYLFNNNINNNILSISINNILIDNYEEVIDRIDKVNFTIYSMYVSPVNNKFFLYLYTKQFIKVNITHETETYECDIFKFTVLYLYLVENFNSLTCIDYSYYINPKDANEVFIINDDLYLNLSNYVFDRDDKIIVGYVYVINCLSNIISNHGNILMIKGKIPAEIINYLPIRSKKFKVYINSDRDDIQEIFIDSINFGPIISINNETPIPNENDSSIYLSDAILTEDKLKRSFWNGFYVNQITMLKSQKALLDTIDSSYRWKMVGYRGSYERYANTGNGSLILEDNATLVENVISNGETLELIIKKQKVHGFLGVVEEGTNPDTSEVSKLLKVYSSVQGEFNPESNYSDLKITLSEMEIIQDRGTNFMVNDNFYFKLGNQDFVYLVLYVLVNGSWISKTFYHMYDAEYRVFQEINTMNVINGRVDNNLLMPRPVYSVYNSSKEVVLPTVTFSEDSQIVPITTLKTTNCLGKSAQLNFVVQDTIPIDWYSWLPLEKVYVSNDKKVIVNPTESDNYSGLTKIVSVNALPSNDIGIDPSTPSELDLSGIDLETGEPLKDN